MGASVAALGLDWVAYHQLIVKDYGSISSSSGFGLGSFNPHEVGMEHTVLNTILNLDSSTIKDKVGQ